MRLNKTDCETIKNTLLNKIEDGQIYLFGNRANDERREGDIDLIIDTPENHHEKIAHEAMTKGFFFDKRYN
jgi:predicted nucleotidyltransferase